MYPRLCWIKLAETGYVFFAPPDGRTMNDRLQVDLGTPLFHGSLTKRVLLGLPEGAFVMSGVTDDSGAPLFARTLPPVSAREQLWGSLKASGVAQRECYVFASARDYSVFLASNPVPHAPPGSPFPRSGGRLQ